jgi:tRNA (adenine57-N1/adenine58-N1)-methyltransferase
MNIIKAKNGMVNMDILNYGDLVILSDKKARKYMITLKEGARFSSQYGFIDHAEIINAGNGGLVKASKGEEYRVFKPTYIDYVMKIKRNAQIIYPKDTAMILMYADIYPGLNVLESGIGQGALSIALLRALGGRGRLTSIEVREDFALQSKNFIHNFLGEVDNHDIVISNIYDGFEGCFDRIVLDLPEPWHVLKHCKTGLIDGGMIVSYIPTVLQVKTYVDTLKETGYFDDIETFEIIKRPWKVDGLSVRPEMWIYNHSAFIVKARKIK